MIGQTVGTTESAASSARAACDITEAFGPLTNIIGSIRESDLRLTFLADQRIGLNTAKWES